MSDEKPKTFGTPFLPGRSGNPGGRPKHARTAAYTGLRDAAELIAADEALSDAEKVVALLGLVRSGLALLKRYQRNGTQRKARARRDAAVAPVAGAGASAELETFAARYLATDGESKP